MFKSKPRPTFQEKIRVGEHVFQQYVWAVCRNCRNPSISLVRLGWGREISFYGFPIGYLSLPGQMIVAKNPEAHLSNSDLSTIRPPLLLPLAPPCSAPTCLMTIRWWGQLHTCYCYSLLLVHSRRNHYIRYRGNVPVVAAFVASVCLTRMSRLRRWWSIPTPI